MLKHLRLLPAVMALGGALALVKIVGLVHDAQAQSAPAAPPAASVQAASASGSDTDDAEASSSEVDVLTSLSKRRAELDARERALQTQQDLISAAEKRVDDKIANLKTLQSQMQALLAQRDVAQQKEVDTLVKTYSSMKPRDAARIFDNLEDSVLIPVAGQMKPDVLAEILAQMQSEAAQKLTLKLADRLKLAEPAAGPPVQTASAQPVAAPASAFPPAVPAASSPAATPAAGPAPATPAVAGK